MHSMALRLSSKCWSRPGVSSDPMSRPTTSSRLAVLDRQGAAFLPSRIDGNSSHASAATADSIEAVARSLIDESAEDEVLEQRVFNRTGKPLRDFEVFKQPRVGVETPDIGLVLHAPDVEERDVIAVPRARFS